MNAFIDKFSPRSYLALASEAPPRQRRRLQAQEQETKRLTDQIEENKAMSTSLRNFAVQAAATLALAGFLGVVLFGVADLATRGVVA